jgi:hypothetical protein
MPEQIMLMGLANNRRASPGLAINQIYDNGIRRDTKPGTSWSAVPFPENEDPLSAKCFHTPEPAKSNS